MVDSSEVAVVVMVEESWVVWLSVVDTGRRAVVVIVDDDCVVWALCGYTGEVVVDVMLMSIVMLGLRWSTLLGMQLWQSLMSDVTLGYLRLIQVKLPYWLWLMEARISCLNGRRWWNCGTGDGRRRHRRWALSGRL